MNLSKRRILGSRVLVLSLSVVISLGANGYLIREKLSWHNAQPEKPSVEMYEEHSEAAPVEQLPDLAIFKKLLELGRQFIPAN
ncbi:MAG: hypothetical protein ACKOAY_02850 [Haliscomenobacter sp.]